MTTGQRQPTDNKRTTNNAEINLSDQQRARIRSIMMRDRAISRVNDATFNADVGSPVPSSTRLVAIPPAVLRVYPRFRGDRVVMVGNEVVIVDPGTYRIVAVLPG
jgi:hypothetical protein